MQIVNAAIIGFGFGGRVFHAPFISATEGMRISKIMTSSEKNRDLANRQYPEVALVKRYEEVLADPNIELVVIAIPNHLHKDYASAALNAGKHVVVEKPFTVTTSEADQLIALAKEQKKLLTVYHNRRLDSDFRTIQKIIDGKMLGRVVEFEARYDRFRNYIKDSWKQTQVPGGGILYDLGAHLIDQALTLFGMPKDIYADLRLQRTEAVATDNFELILSYPGIKVSLKAGMLVREKGPRYSVFGTKGTFLKYGMDVQESALLSGLTLGDTNQWGKESEDSWGLLHTEIGGLTFKGKVESEPGDYRLFYQNLYAAISGSEKLLISPDSARAVIRVIELAKESNAAGKRIPCKSL